MARKLRVEFPGAIYHVMNRGNRREPVFLDDQDRRRFVDTLGETCAKTGWQVHAYCLMPNHFHIVIETPQPNLVAGMKWLLGTYTNRFNRRHAQCGHLFSGRYKALAVDHRSPGYLRTVCEYVHLNPARAHQLAPQQPLRSYPWNSYTYYVESPKRRPAWLRVDRVLGENGIFKDSPAGRRRLELRLEERCQEDHPDQWKPIRRGWCFGDEEFRRELLGRVEGHCGENHYGDERRESDQQKAQRLVQEGLSQAGWTEEDLLRRRKNDPIKLVLATRLRQETTQTLKWIAERLGLGTWKSLTRRLYEHRQTAQNPKSGNARN